MITNPRFVRYNYSPGRYGATIDTIVIHTEQGYEDGTASWFNNPAASASAHYGVRLNGGIDQFVAEGDTAWQAGNWEVNKRSIGIENEDNADPFITRPDSQYQSIAALVADICHRYGLPINRDTVKGHREVSNSHPQCPGNIDVDRVVQMAQAIAAESVLVTQQMTTSFASEPLDEVVLVTYSVLQVRTGPGTNYAGNQANTIDGLLHAGDSVHIVGVTAGDDPYGDGRNTWLKTLNDLGQSHWIWAGGTNYRVAPTPDPVTPTETTNILDPAPNPVPVVAVAEATPAPEPLVVDMTAASSTGSPVPTVTTSTTPELPYTLTPLEHAATAVTQTAALVIDLITGKPVFEVAPNITLTIMALAKKDGTTYLVTEKMVNDNSSLGIATKYFRPHQPIDSLSHNSSTPPTLEQVQAEAGGLWVKILKALHLLRR